MRAALISSGELHYKPPFADDLDWITDDTVIDGDGLGVIGINALYAEVAGAVILVDPSVFAPDRELPRARLVAHPGVVAALDVLSVDPASVTHVLITHLHADHVNALAVVDAAGPRPRFPNAEHIVPELDWEAFVVRGEGEEEELEELRYHIDPVEAAGLVRRVGAEYSVTSRVRTSRTGGETPGHQVVSIETGSGELVYLGDLVHYPIEFAHFEWFGVRGRDEVTLLSARERLLGARAARDSVFVFTHGRFPGWGVIEEDGSGGRRWRYLDP